MYARAINLFILCLLTGIGSASAHDLRGLGDKTSKINTEINHQYLLQLSAQQPDPDARYVYARLLLWKAGQTLKGCFVSGTGQEKDFFVATANDMLKVSLVNLKIDFGAAPEYRACSEPGRRADMRVSFTNGCCSAYVGQNAHHPDAQAEPSIFLQDLLTYTPPKRRQIAIHEFFHALGLEHEHQSPPSVCEEQFNKATVLARTGWNDTDYRVNLKRLDRDHRSYTWSSYDNTSIMKYFFEVDELKNGKKSDCYSEENYEPSTRDYEGLRDAYPAAPPAVSKERSRAVFSGIEGSQVSPALRQLARELRRMEME